MMIIECKKDLDTIINNLELLRRNNGAQKKVILNLSKVKTNLDYKCFERAYYNPELDKIIIE